MTLGLAPTQGDLLRSSVNFCHGRVAEDSIYAVLHRECFNLFLSACKFLAYMRPSAEEHLLVGANSSCLQK